MASMRIPEAYWRFPLRKSVDCVVMSGVAFGGDRRLGAEMVARTIPSVMITPAAYS